MLVWKLSLPRQAAVHPHRIFFPPPPAEQARHDVRKKRPVVRMAVAADADRRFPSGNAGAEMAPQAAEKTGFTPGNGTGAGEADGVIRKRRNVECVAPAQPIEGRLDAQLSIFSAAMKASCGISTFPNWRIFFLPAFCFSRSLRLRVASPP